MNSERKKTEQEYAAQLSDFESQLKYTLDDDSLQQEVFRAVRDLMKESRESEADIRRILRDRFEAGKLREETLQVVERMLERAASDFEETMPDEDKEVDFGSTDVIPRTVFREQPGLSQLQPGSILRDRFLLQKQVSGGSMGVVFKALDRRMAEVDGVTPWVAIKVLTTKLSRNAHALRAIQQEAAKGRYLSHPNIVRFIDLDREDDAYFIVMEWIEGRSLAEILDDPNSAGLDLDRILDIAGQLADALEHAHRCGVVHADVKPGNVMLTPEGTVKLIDFGVARIRQRQQQRAGDFDPRVLGAATPAYSSMQVLTGEDPVPADDVFSLGCLIYRMIAGYRVFGPRNAAEAAEAGMAPQQPQGLGDAQWKTLKKALSYSRVTRFSSPRAFIDELTSGGRSEDEPSGIYAVKVDRPPPEEAEESRAVWPWVAAGIVALGGGGFLAQEYGYIDVDEFLPARTATAPAVASDSAIPTQPPAPVDEPAPGAARPAGAETPQADAAPLPGAPDVSPAISDEPETLAPSESGNDSAVEAARPAPVASADDAGMPPATHTLELGRIEAGGLRAVNVTLREDGEAAIIDLIRSEGLDSPLELIVDEVRAGSERPPPAISQYRLTNGGEVRFAPGQSIAQVVIEMTSDPLREADSAAELVVLDARLGDELGIIDLRLEDDDQRAFEADIAPNTVGFAVSQIAVRESDAAAQIDLIRYNPDASSQRVTFRVRDVTATQGEDYFPPSSESVVFGPNERSARILVPLVQDAETESDEAFFIELTGPAAGQDADIIRRIAVMIRDDD